MDRNTMKPFYFHFSKENNCMVVNFKDKQHLVKDIECLVPTQTRWSDTHPTLVLHGYTKEIIITEAKALII